VAVYVESGSGNSSCHFIIASRDSGGSLTCPAVSGRNRNFTYRNRNQTKTNRWWLKVKQDAGLKKPKALASSKQTR
jgi:hypothetical protein